MPFAALADAIRASSSLCSISFFLAFLLSVAVSLSAAARAFTRAQCRAGQVLASVATVDRVEELFASSNFDKEAVQGVNVTIEGGEATIAGSGHARPR